MTQRVSRAKEQVVFENWRDYLKQHSPERPSLCGVLRQCGAPIHNAEVDAAKKRVEAVSPDSPDEKALRADEELEFAQTRAGLPWLTPVLGTGCVADLPVDAVKTVWIHISKGLAASGLSEVTLGDGRPVAAVVQPFAFALLKTRYPAVAPPPATGYPGFEDEDNVVPEAVIAVKALLAAALLQEFITGASAVAAPLQSDPFLLGETDRVSLLDQTAMGREIADMLLPVLRRALQRFAEEAETTTHYRFLRDFINAIDSGVAGVGDPAGRPTASFADCRLLAEISWQFVAFAIGHYAGWNDLLCLLGMKTEELDRNMHNPYLTNLGTTWGFLNNALEQLTHKSWLDRQSGQERPTNIYDLTTAVTLAQTQFARSYSEEAYFPVPQSTTLITSLDIEFEMALMSAKQAFLVVAPFEVVIQRHDTEHSYLTWLCTEIAQEESEAACRGEVSPIEIFSNDRREWSLATHSMFASGRYQARRLPIVVRLVGCPLFSAPAPYIRQTSLRQPGEVVPQPYRSLMLALPEISKEWQIDLMPSLLLDENSAVHQGLAEMRTESNESEGNQSDARLGIPIPLLEDTELIFRFWLLLGVQLADDAVRMRVTSAMTAPDYRPQHLRRTPMRGGVAVNISSAPRDRDVFHWQGFDVVGDRCAAVLDDIQHHLQHLDNFIEWHRSNHECALGRGA